MPTTRRQRTRHGIVAVALASLVALAGIAGPHLLGAGAAPTPGDAPAALDWLTDELEAGGHHLDRLGTTDWGLTADAALALLAGGRVADPDVSATVDAVLAGFDAHSTWNDLGAEFAGVRLAGPTAKTLLVAQLAGRAAAVVDPLEAELRSLVVATGGDAGRLADRNPHSPDASNGFGQAFGIVALARTPTGAPEATVSFLLAQQCPDGSFRLNYLPAGGCSSAAAGDTDATALAIEALLAVPRTTPVSDALVRAITWVRSIQDPLTGAFGGTGPTAAANANSTGLLGQVLRAAGHLDAADAAAGWIAQLQLAGAGAGAAVADVGAIAYDGTALGAAVTGGVTDLSRDQWRRSTSQAVLALGLPVLGSVGGPPCLPVDLPDSTTTTLGGSSTSSTPTSSTSSTSSSTTSTTSSSTTSSTSSTSTTSTSTTSTSLPGARPSGRAVVLGTSASSASTRSSSTASPSTSSAGAASLAGTGVDAEARILLAGSLIAIGIVALVVGRRTRRP